MRITTTDWINDPKIKLPPNHTEFVIGDVHGDIDNLDNLIDWVDNNAPNAHLTSIGDVMDRGKDSIGCIKRVTSRFDTYLPGNHEILMIGGIANTRETLAQGHLDIFANNGGMWLLNAIMAEKVSPLQYFERHIGKQNLDVLLQNGRLLPDSPTVPTIVRKIGSLFMVHAGLRPGLGTIDNAIEWVHQYNAFQLIEDHPLWIRNASFDHKDSFYKDENGDDIVVVHGHSFEQGINHDPQSSDEYGKRWPVGYTRIDGYRIGLDSGSFMTHVLTGCLFENGRYKVVNSRP